MSLELIFTLFSTSLCLIKLKYFFIDCVSVEVVYLNIVTYKKLESQTRESTLQLIELIAENF